MKKILPALVSMLLLATPATALGGGGGGGGGNEGGGSHGASSEEGSGGGRRHRILTTSDGYVPLDPLTATVHSDFRLRGVMHIEAGLEIPDNRLRQRAERLMPRLRDRYVSALAMYAGSNYSYGEVPDADRISELLQQATDEALGEEGADILLGMVIIHAN
ncbi:hypothetical protein V0U79_11260 [Hyphobacterium sp. HN65]|uniref:Tat pathway signal protein n=1 Tax=Hyphobacterium lacteum TaxID=3116575 RepID=A0ABU7LSV6_9PROT|nr:hypothetical protein [Hyphobacterium sp. HN65]MEE2526950.1 hypothetical protein [Hyphobacterium sp. HN65]